MRGDLLIGYWNKLNSGAKSVKQEYLPNDLYDNQEMLDCLAKMEDLSKDLNDNQDMLMCSVKKEGLLIDCRCNLNRRVKMLVPEYLIMNYYYNPDLLMQ
jgi:hypothetical protein